MNKKYCIFHSHGGLGKAIAATAVAKCIKNNYPDRELIVVTGWPDVFLNLRFVDRAYRLDQVPYFYDDYIKDNDCIVFAHDPYQSNEFITKKSSLIEAWCKTYQLKYENEEPELVFNLIQRQIPFEQCPPTEKPVLLMQPYGGPLGDRSYRWARDMPYCVIDSVIEEFRKDYDIFYVTREKMQQPKNVFIIDKPLPPMHILSILYRSHKRLLINSSFQHAAAAMNLPSTVLWIGTEPSMFGYPIHNNITANKNENFKRLYSYLWEQELDEIPESCPYEDEREIFDIDQIIKILRR